MRVWTEGNINYPYTSENIFSLLPLLLLLLLLFNSPFIWSVAKLTVLRFIVLVLRLSHKKFFTHQRYIINEVTKLFDYDKVAILCFFLMSHTFVLLFIVIKNTLIAFVYNTLRCDPFTCTLPMTNRSLLYCKILFLGFGHFFFFGDRIKHTIIEIPRTTKKIHSHL